MSLFRYLTVCATIACLGSGGPAALAQGGVTTTAVFSDPVPGGQPRITVGDWQLPAVPPPGMVRVRLVRSEICNSDRRVLAGTKTADVATSRIVLGHEGIGRIELVGEAAPGHLKAGDLVVLMPHVLKPDDAWLRQGLPNLSPHMQHLGIHVNGVFADRMDFPAENAHRIAETAAVTGLKGNLATYYDQMVMTEPLSCVRRGYELLAAQKPNRTPFRTALVLGAGPMGVIHALHLQQRFPGLNVTLHDVDPIRRAIARKVPRLTATVAESLDASSRYDLVVVATSSPEANTATAIRSVRDDGDILLFSGVDMAAGDPRPIVAGIDLETVHRREGTVYLQHGETPFGRKSIHFQGTSGYIERDFAASVQELQTDFRKGPGSFYHGVSSTAIETLGSLTAKDLAGYFQDTAFPEPALVPLLRLYDPAMTGAANVHHYLKILVRH